MAGGCHQVDPHRGALEEDFIHVLITDAITAQEIIINEKEI